MTDATPPTPSPGSPADSPSGSPASARLSRSGDWTVLEFDESMQHIVESNVEEARDHLVQAAAAAMQTEPAKLLVNLSGVGFFGSSFIEGLFRAWKTLKAAGGTFAISNCHEHCREVLTVTRLTDLWTIYDDHTDAVTN